MVTDGMQDRENGAAIAECSCGCGVHEKKERDAAEKKSLITRLKRIEGQIRGIRGMLDNDCYCIDILTQVSAATSALNCFSRELLSEHLKNCVREDVQEGHDDKLDEVIRILPKLMK